MTCHYHRIAAGALALAVALAGAVTPCAWADPQPLAQAEAATAANNSPPSPVRSNPDQQATTPMKSGAALPHDPRPRSDALSNVYRSPTTPSVNGAYTEPRSDVVSERGHGSGRAAATVVRSGALGGSFDWGDAGIGAGAALALVAIAFAGARAATSSRRHTRPRLTASN